MKVVQKNITAPKNTETSVCSIDFAFRRLGGKYKARVLMYLHQNQVLRYGELRRAIADIAPKMLTQALRELEADALVHRAVFHEVPPRVEYMLTETGAAMIPLIKQLRDWGERQMAKERIPSLGLNVNDSCHAV